MKSLDFQRAFRSSKVPEVDGYFWFLKLLTTAMGEATSDYLVHRFNPELAVLGGAVIFLIALWWQLRAPRYLTITYWTAVVMVSVFGTMCADVLHVGFSIPYVVSASLYALLLTAVFVAWWRSEHSLSIHEITSTRRELFYWAVVTMTFALGTAVGDMTATTFRLGYLKSGILFAILFILPALGFKFLRLNAVTMFWASYVLARPVGASFADYLGVSQARGGLNWGPGNVALMFFSLIVLGVIALLLRTRKASGT
jgi:uncharacterized membrane-anchored protein